MGPPTRPLPDPHHPSRLRHGPARGTRRPDTRPVPRLRPMAAAATIHRTNRRTRLRLPCRQPHVGVPSTIPTRTRQSPRRPQEGPMTSEEPTTLEDHPTMTYRYRL